MYVYITYFRMYGMYVCIYVRNVFTAPLPLYIHIHIHIHIRIIYMYIYIYMYMYMYIRAHTHIYTYAYACTYTHTYTYVHIYIYMPNTHVSRYSNSDDNHSKPNFEVNSGLIWAKLSLS